MIPYFSLFIQGIGVTLGCWILSGSISFIAGSLLGILNSSQQRYYLVKKIISFYTFIAKGIPAYVQILISFFVLPSITGLHISGFTAATGALAFCSSGYVTEIMRGCINAIAQGQWDAGFALGYSRIQIIRYIIVPQALRIALPALIGECEQLLKSTCLLATIGVTEITRVGMNIISRELNPGTIYAIIACIYLGLSGLLHMTIAYYERRRIS